MKALLAQMQARPGLQGVSVTWTKPYPDIPKEMVFFGNCQVEQAGASLGAGIRQETYDIQIYVVVHQEGNDPLAVFDRCNALCEEIAATVSPTDGATDLGIVDASSILSVIAEYATTTLQTFAEDDGYTVQAAPASVSVTARIK